MLEIFTLGGLEIRRGGEPVTGFGLRKSQALLCYLALTGRPHSRAALVGLLWGETTEANARASLRKALAELRRLLPLYLMIARGEVALNRARPYRLDVELFEQGVSQALHSRHSRLTEAGAAGLAQAVALYRGDFLAGFYVRHAPAFEEWALLERERLRLCALRALYTLAEHHAAQGGYAEAIDTLSRLLALEPAQEEAHRELMRLLALSGRPEAALRQYQVCRRALAEELSVAPGEGTTALYERIKAGEITASLPSPPHNLPTPLTPLMGRAAELAEIKTRLQDPTCRLLTLAGPGGVGKTHLALEAAAGLPSAAQHDLFRDGIYWVALEPLRAVEAFPPTLAQALGFPLQTESDAWGQLLDFLRHKRLLLVLDGFEHLLVPPSFPPDGGDEGGGTDLVTEILQVAPGVKMLVTSRARLNVGFEHLIPLAGLHCPDGAAADEVAGSGAVQLFVAAARRVRPGFAPAAGDLFHAARICRLVDGSPLGILLAAGWARMLAPGEIADRLADGATDGGGHGLDLLASHRRDLPPRQRSMRAVFDHSYGLLTARQRELFPALAVFRGGFTPGAALKVAGASFHELGALADRSLVQRTPPGRFRLHDLLRQYAAEKLAHTPVASAAAHDRHCAYYTARLRQWGVELKGPRQHETLAAMALDVENARAAWDWAAQGSQTARLERALEALCCFYKWRGRYEDGESACRLAVEGLRKVVPPSEPGGGAGGLRVLAHALAWQGVFSYGLGHLGVGGELLRQSLSLLDDPALAGQDTRPERAFVLWRLGRKTADSDRAGARRLYEEGLALYRALGDDWGAANVLHALGEVAWNGGAYGDARTLFQESLALRRRSGDRRGVAGSLMWLDRTAIYQGRPAEGVGLLQESIDIYRDIGDRASLAMGLHDLGVRFGFLGEYVQAHATLERSLALYTDLGFRDTRDRVDLALGMTDVHLGRYGAARQRGEQGLALCRETGTRRGSGLFCLLLGHVALAEGAYREAEARLQESSAIFEEIGQRAEGATAQAVLAVAQWMLGGVSQAQRHLSEALRVACELQAIMPLSYALLGMALLLAGQGRSKRAVELYALVARHPRVANSRWVEDVYGRYITAVAASLPAQVVAAAQERGRACELWATATEMLETLKDWQSS